MAKYTIVNEKSKMYLRQIRGFSSKDNLYTHDIEKALTFVNIEEAKKSASTGLFVYQIDDDIEFGDE